MHALVAFGWLLAFVLSSPRAVSETRFIEQGELVDQVFARLDERMSLMPDVAAWKWTQSAAVIDAKREQVVIDGAVDQARPLGLSSEAIRNLFILQVRLASSLQVQLHEQWRKQGFDTARPVPNLQDEIRPRLDRLTPELLRALYLAAPVLQQADFAAAYAPAAERRLRSAGWSEHSRREMLSVLGTVRVTGAPSLERIRAAGTLRIGTTGDYAPFSLEASQQLTGADIERARSLAQALGVEPLFIRTTWATLLDDLREDEFDVALSGISITPARANVAAFSVPYHSGGKTILSRCRDVRRYRGLAAIDRPGVRVIVNPGGTNEQYVREHLHRAHIRVFPDNRTIFEEIRADRADVMITDDVEVQWQTRRHTDLCRAMAGTLTRADKAVLMPRDAPLIAAVNHWLSAQIEAGEPRP
jgi:cyclohexadienyl dehydratase